MRKNLKIKLFKIKAYSQNNNANVKMIVIGFNNKVNGSYCERIGVFYTEHELKLVMLNLNRFAYWLRRGGIKIKPKVSEVIGLFGEIEYNNMNKLDKNIK